MKTIEFGEDGLGNLQEIGNQLFGDETDPRSPAYVRKLVRPKINWFKISLFFVASITLLFLPALGLKHLGLPTLWAIIAAAAIYLVFICLTVKRAVICMVRIYQKYAPDSVRNKCRFEPSCSEYMILSIEKYGLFKGVKKGICRLKRCNVNGGGFDFP